jgi:hypothetical protein
VKREKLNVRREALTVHVRTTAFRVSIFLVTEGLINSSCVIPGGAQGSPGQKRVARNPVVSIQAATGFRQLPE